jgi:AcrR family transcriptional regulator
MNERSFFSSWRRVPLMTVLIAVPDVRIQDVRTSEILTHARKAFAEKGFDGASMQDLARSAGMSVGNFYRYFPSKAAMVEALISADMAEMEQDFSQILNSADPIRRLRETIGFRIGENTCGPDDGRMWAEITAAALRKPEIAAITAKMDAAITRHLCAVFAQVTGLGQNAAEATFGAQARFIVMLVVAATMEAPCPGPRHGDVLTLVQRAIDRTLDDILQIKKGQNDAS